MRAAGAAAPGAVPIADEAESFTLKEGSTRTTAYESKSKSSSALTNSGVKLSIRHATPVKAREAPSSSTKSKTSNASSALSGATRQASCDVILALSQSVNKMSELVTTRVDERFSAVRRCIDQRLLKVEKVAKHIAKRRNAKKRARSSSVGPQGKPRSKPKPKPKASPSKHKKRSKHTTSGASKKPKRRQERPHKKHSSSSSDGRTRSRSLHRAERPRDRARKRPKDRGRRESPRRRSKVPKVRVQDPKADSSHSQSSSHSSNAPQRLIKLLVLSEYLKDKSKNTLIIDMNQLNKQTVWDFKRDIERKCITLPRAEMQILHRGQTLSDWDFLKKYNFSNSDCIQVIQRARSPKGILSAVNGPSRERKKTRLQFDNAVR